MGKEFVILLKGSEDERTLPISIGQLEAQSIAIQLNQIPFERPLTHDLFKNVLTEIGCRLVKTEIISLLNETFYARLIVENRGKKLEIDSRPSDAIALALRFSAPIYVDEKVMEEAGIILPEESKGEEAIQDSSTEEPVDLTPLETLQRQLRRAIDEERYEEAARIRDDINKMTKSN
jgi:uncharacterized protein